MIPSEENIFVQCCPFFLWSIVSSVFGATILGVLVWLFRLKQHSLFRREQILEHEKMRLEGLERSLFEREQHLQLRFTLMTTVDEIIRAISRESNMEHLLSSILHSLMQLIGQAQKSSMYVFDDLRSVFRFRAALGYKLEEIAGITLTREEAEHRWAGNDCKVAEGIYLIQDFPENNEGEKFEGFAPPACALAMTVISQDQLHGVVFLDNFDDKEAFGADAVEKLIAVREHINAAFEKVSIIDILERQSLSLHEANNVKTELLNIAAHDLKNPLGTMMLMVELLQDILLPIPNSKEYELLESVSYEAERMLKLVHNLLTVNMLEENAFGVTLIRLDMANVVRQLCEKFHLAALEKQQILVYETLTDSSMLCIADELLLFQIVENLLSNAMKFSQPNTTIRLHTSLKGQYVRLEVQDEGPGISVEDQSKLFGKFARLSARPTGGEHSTGLGLSIVKRMVEAMNGKVWCESVVGKGSTFIIEVPSLALPPSSHF